MCENNHNASQQHQHLMSFNHDLYIPLLVYMNPVDMWQYFLATTDATLKPCQLHKAAQFPETIFAMLL